MKFSSVTKSLVALLALHAASTAWSAGKAPTIPPNTIQCTENGFNESEGTAEDETPVVGSITVRLGKDGKASQIIVNRNADKGFPAMKLTFDGTNSKFVHKIISTVGPDGESTNMFNIKEIEVVKAKDSKGNSVEVFFNDHTYAGWPGSSAKFSVGKKTVETSGAGHSMDCQGKLRLPMDRPDLSEILE